MTELRLYSLQVFRTLGVEDEEIDLMMSEADVNGDGEIEYAEFLLMIFNRILHLKSVPVDNTGENELL